MGSPLNEAGRLSDERLHRVKIEHASTCMQTEVPQWLYQT
jgi:hypothetical protein